MRKIIITIIALGFGFAASAQTSLILNADAACAHEGKAAQSVEALALGDKTLDLRAGYGIWSPEMVDNSIMQVRVAYKLADKFAFSLSALNMSDRQPSLAYNELGAPLGSFKSSELSLGLGVAYKITSWLSAGVQASMLTSTLSPEIAGSAYAADLGVQAVFGGLRAGLAVRNLGTALSYGTRSYQLPAFAQLSVGYQIAGLRASAELDYLFCGDLMAALGAEYGIADMVFLRAGYHYGSGESALPSYASCGLGLKFFGISLNANYLLGSETLGGSMLFGIGYEF